MSTSETIFSKIIRREIPAQIVFETDRVLAFKDVNPQAPVHVLIIPKEVIRDVGEATANQATVLGELLLAGAQIARTLGVAEDGYRLVINTGKNGGQTVFHLHVHLLAGRPLEWPPG